MGGAEASLLDLLASVRAAEPEWELRLVVSGEGPLVRRAEALGVPTTIIPFPPAVARLGDAGAGGPAGRQFSRLTVLGRLLVATPSILAYVRRLRRVLRELAPDLIHTNGLKMHVLGPRARPRTVPVIWHIHDYISRRPLMARLLKRDADRCSVAIANSRSVAEDVRAVCGRALTVKTVYNGIDLECFAPTGSALDLDALAGLPPAEPGTVRVGLLATLARWKGHATFLKALALLPPNLPVRGYITTGSLYQTDGSQISLAELKTLITDLGLTTQRVGLTNFIDRPAAAMRALDVVVHASTQPEPFGLVIAEGMACGKAVITSCAGGASELVEDEVNALTHHPGDADELAHHIAKLATDSGLRARLGAAGRVTAERRFNRSRLARELIPIYRQAVSPLN
ncbi:MAG TPA: glycosyltransferase [Pyrinomonadaceae bacterium]|nr:glycosyltransferase [Pyrinomonadaceae bacterium]